MYDHDTNRIESIQIITVIHPPIIRFLAVQMWLNLPSAVTDLNRLSWAQQIWTPVLLKSLPTVSQVLTRFIQVYTGWTDPCPGFSSCRNVFELINSSVDTLQIISSYNSIVITLMNCNYTCR